MLRKITKLYFLKHPLISILYLSGQKKYIYKKIICDTFKHLFNNYNRKSINKYLAEIENNELIPNNHSSEDSSAGNSINTTFGKFIYTIVRYMKPEVFVETGVANGYSSWIILNALNKNKKGLLYSIDLPDNDTNENYNLKSKNEKTGWVIPDDLKCRWKLILGDSKIVLPKLLKELQSIDMFLHDSNHSYEYMLFEYNQAIKYLKKNMLLLSDDVHNHSLFEDFINNNHLKAVKFRKGGVIINKNYD